MIAQRLMIVSVACLAAISCSSTSRTGAFIECGQHSFSVVVTFTEELARDDINEIVAQALNDIGFSGRRERFERDVNSWSGNSVCYVEFYWGYEVELALTVFVPVAHSFDEEVRALNAEIVAAINERAQKDSAARSALLAEKSVVIYEERRRGTRAIIR